ncbi:MAG: ThuA domain-containing protein [Thermoflavifilum sp.]|nr:ThuA domain-containing protein [Thermoflavifilum sp.]
MGCACLVWRARAQSLAPHRILVFTRTMGYHHASIPDGVKAIEQLASVHQVQVDTTSDAHVFQMPDLRRYAAIVFLNTTGNVLDSLQQLAFQQYIRGGGGYVGIHAAADCEYDWPWYGKLVGAYFKSHPAVQQARLWIQLDPRFPELEAFPHPWVRTDEWYNWRMPPAADQVHVLIWLDENSYKGGENGSYHPVVWYHDMEGGRAFYMEFGHTAESYAEPAFLQLLWLGLQYAMGEK